MCTNRSLRTPRVPSLRRACARPSGSGARRPPAWLAPLLAVLTSSSAADAQRAVSLSRFEPAERGSRFFLADSLELGHAASSSAPLFATGIASSWAYRAHTYGTLREGERSGLVEHALYLHPGASVVLDPGARFALDLPVAAFQSGEPTSLAGTRYGAPVSPRIGDLRASFDLRLAGPGSRDREGVALAAGVSAWLPTGSGANFAGEDATRFGVHVASAARFGGVLASARAGYMYRPEGWFGGSRVGSEVSAVLGVAYAGERWTIGPELHAATVIDAPLSKRATPVEVLAGARRTFGPFRAGAGIGTAVVGGLGAAPLRVVLSLEWVPASSPSGDDRDRDGVPDADDVCPDVPGASGGPAATRGCPAAPIDRDRDGIPDAEDSCPDVPGVWTGDRRTHGCPGELVPPRPLDPCPSTPSASRTEGCPSDADGDGVLDSDDVCPDVPGVRSEDDATNGCPPR